MQSDHENDNLTLPEEKTKATRTRTSRRKANAADAADEKPKTTRKRATKKTTEASETDDEKPKTTRKRATKKTAEASETADEKPKTTRKRATKKTAEASETADEKPKTTRKRTTKKAAEATEDADEKPKTTRKRASRKKAAASEEAPAETAQTEPVAVSQSDPATAAPTNASAPVATEANAELASNAQREPAAEPAVVVETAPTEPAAQVAPIVPTEPAAESAPEAPTGPEVQDESAVSETTAPSPEDGDQHQRHEHGEHKKHHEYSQQERPEVTGILDLAEGGFGFLRFDNFLTSEKDIYVSPTQIRRFNLKSGDEICGIARHPGQNEKFGALLYVKTVNGDDPGTAIHRPQFESLTPIFPNERLKLEGAGGSSLAVRLIDLIAPIGKGQRGMIVAPPKAGKTTLLKSIAGSLETNHPDVELFVLLVDERPEEVTDMKRSLKRGQVIYSTFDELPQHHVKVAEMMLARAKRLAEHGRDVIILLDSLTRLTRAYNLVVPPSGRTLSGGIDPGAFYGPKRFFGAARNIENGGSITILATALVDTGSRMDDVIFEEFKGTGNMELHLDRKLSEKRIFPAIDIYKSGTRKEDLLMSQDELEAVWMMRRAMSNRQTQDVTEEIIDNLAHTRHNRDFIEIIRKIFYQEHK